MTQKISILRKIWPKFVSSRKTKWRECCGRSGKQFVRRRTGAELTRRPRTIRARRRMAKLEIKETKKAPEVSSHGKTSGAQIES